MMRLKIGSFILFETAKKLKDKRLDLGDTFMKFIRESMELLPRARNSLTLLFRCYLILLTLKN